MDINVGIVDQQVRGLAVRLRDRLQLEFGRQLDGDGPLLRSVAFVVLCAKTMLDLTDEEAIEALTEGGNDFGVDAIHVGDLVEQEFVVTLIQGKYHHKNLEGTKGFPQSGVEKAVQATRTLFDPEAPIDLNPRLRARVEDIRSLICDGNLPRVRYLLCSNGASWKRPESQAIIERENFRERASFEHIGPDVLVQTFGAAKPVREQIRFSGKSFAEDIQFVRVFVGKVSVVELARIVESHGDRLLDRNIRRFLGLHENRVNEAIRGTLVDDEDRANFFFYNNGVTLICDRFDFNSLQSENHAVRVEGLQIINGGQTSKTIQATLSELRTQRGKRDSDLEQAHVLVRLYQVPKDAGPTVQNITLAVNSQNPVDLQDLRSGDEVQKRLELSMKELGYTYRRQRSDGVSTASDISIATAAEAVLSVWRQQPQRVRFRRNALFNVAYHDIFTPDLNAAQVVIAVLLFRIAENKRRRPPAAAPEFVRYASNFASMLMGRYLLLDLGRDLKALDHRTFDESRDLVEARGDEYFGRAVEDLQGALNRLYGDQPLSLQRLAATFRRGDLLTTL